MIPARLDPLRFLPRAGVQFYTGNYLDGIAGRSGSVIYGKHHGFCLETQHFPDSVNRAHFPPVWLVPGQQYRHATEHTFGCLKTSTDVM